MKFLTMTISVIALSLGLQTAMAKSMEDQDAMLAFGSTVDSEVLVLAALEMEETTGSHWWKKHKKSHTQRHGYLHKDYHWHPGHGIHKGWHRQLHKAPHKGKKHWGPH